MPHASATLPRDFFDRLTRVSGPIETATGLLIELNGLGHHSSGGLG